MIQILLWHAVISPVFALEVKTPIERKIVEEAIDQGVNPKLALKVAKCESGLRAGVKSSQSSASGVYQFIRSTFESTRIAMGLPLGIDVFDWSMNIKMGVWLMKRDGAMAHWFPSAHCWK